MKALYFSLILIFVAFQLPSQSKPKFELGAKWTYEQIVRVPPKVDFVTYEIIDTLTIDSMSCYMLDQFNIVFCVDGNRVYGNRVFGPGDFIADDFQLIYDFDAVDTFRTRCVGFDGLVLDCEAPVDSIITAQIADGQLLTRRKIEVDLTTECHGAGFNPSRIYDGIGHDYGPFISRIDFCNFLGDSFNSFVGQIRCFENSTESFRFVDYPCDTIWSTLMSSVEDIDNSELVIYPNPTEGEIYVERPAPNLKYRVTDIQGQVIAEGPYSDYGITLPSSGLYFITFISRDREWTKRVVSTDSWR